MLPSARGVIITGFGLLIATLVTVATGGNLAFWFAVTAGAAGTVLGLAAAILIAAIILRQPPSSESAALAVAGRELKEERERAVAQLRKSEEKFRGLLESAPDAVVIVDADGRIVLVNTQTDKMFGYSRDELIGEPVEMLVPKRSREAHVGHRTGYYSEPRTRPMGAGRELTGRRKDGSEFPVDISLSTLETEDEVLVTSVIRDISERKQAKEELRESEERLRILFEYAPDAYFLTDLQGNLIDLNRAAEEITGLSKKEVIGKNYIDLDLLPPEDIPKAAAILAESRAGKPAGPAELTLNHRNGGSTAVEVRTFPVEINRQTLVLTVERDITERKRAEKIIRHLAYHDVLTDLPNRALLYDRFTQALAQAGRSKQGLAVMSLDLDRFKVINDSLGHSLGDRLLQAVAERLTGLMREGDTVARVGGDEFILLLPATASPEDAAKIAERILKALRPPFHLNGQEVHTTTSIGISLYPRGGEDAATLLKNAGAAKYRAKELGGNNHQFHSPSTTAGASQQLALVDSLRHAVEHAELVVYYQPQADVDSGQDVGVEALVRWQHPDWGLVAPSQFIPLAEETDLILPLGEWVLRTACAQFKAWQEAGLPPLRLAVNLSARQFQQQDLVETIARVLKQTRLDPHCLELEITEGAAMQNMRLAATVLHDLQEMGLRIAIDDFGTGYSSLSYLKDLPIDTLKIDQSFVRDVIADRSDAAIVTAIIAMAHSLDLKVIAEGVETKHQLAFLRERGCDEYQGYLLARPMSARAFGATVKQHKRSRGQSGAKVT